MGGLTHRTVCCFSWPVLLAGVGAAAWWHPARVCAEDFSEYQFSRTFELPEGAGPFDVLADGRIVTLVSDELFVEEAEGSATFAFYGTLPAADIGPFGASFLRVSLDGGQIAVGNNGGVSFTDFEVGVFDSSTLAGVWFDAESFDAAWIDASHLVLSAGDFSSGVVTALDVTSSDPANPVNPTIVAGIGGASGGVALDAKGRLFTGNGFAGAGPSGTGAVKAFDAAARSAAMSGGPIIDFEADGTLVVELLSAASLGFDGEGNLHVGGGDFGEPDADYAALVRAGAIGEALAGAGPVDPSDPLDVRRFDPDEPDDANFYTVLSNGVTGELYLRSGAGPVYVLAASGSAIPAASAWGCAVMTLCVLTAGTIALRRDRKGAIRAMAGAA